MLDFVTGEAAHTTTADYIERGLFKLLLAMGAKLLTLFFVIRSEASHREALQQEDGQRLYYQRDTKREYFSIFGKVELFRPYFYNKGLGGEVPLDAELSLGDDCYSDLVREVSEYLGTYDVYHKTSDILWRFLGIQLSTRALQENIATDVMDVEAYYEQKPAPALESEAEILVIQADGKGVPMVMEEPVEKKVRLGKGEKRGTKKEAVVTAVYTIAPKVRTPEEVVASFFKQTTDLEEKKARQHIRPQNKHIWATLDGKDVALERLSKQVQSRQSDYSQDFVALCDGCEALQTRIAGHFRDFTLILDFIHADEYLWDAANCLFGEDRKAQRLEWMIEHTSKILSGQTQHVITELRQLSLADNMKMYQRTQLEKSAAYFERNLPYMDYPTYLAKGWPIASGVIEGACRHFVKDRCELSGMRWTQIGAENLLRMRAIAENSDWDAYHTFRKTQRHLRLYGKPMSTLTSPEIQAINSSQKVPETTPARGQQHYGTLPLAA